MAEWIDGRQWPQRQVERIGNYLGLAQRAGKIAAGDSAVTAALQSHSAQLVVIAGDAADAVFTQLEQAKGTQKVPFVLLADKDRLGLWVGKSRRGALAVKDAGFSRAILACCQQEQGNEDAKMK